MGNVTMATTYNRGGRSLVRARVAGDLTVVPITFTMNSSYSSGGDGGVTLPSYKDLISPWMFPTVAGYTFKLDAANSKIIAYIGGAATVAQTEVTAGQDLSALGALTLFLLVRA